MRTLRNLPAPLYPVLSFALFILAASLVLMAFPTTQGTHISFVDSLFLITSATCVTGLSVLDIGSELTVWGQLTILGSIQLGGLGIMTFSTVFILAIGGALSFRSRFVLQDIFAHAPQADLHKLLRRVFLFTLALEAAGALLLYMRFREQFPFGKACYHALFNSISAFCNAGFSLFSDNLMRYRGDYLVSLTIAGLIILGGIGFMVMHELVQNLENKASRRHYWSQLSLHTKMVLVTTAALLGSGTVFFLLSEWHNTLCDLDLPEKLLAAFFQSVTPRTAGFNTLDYGIMNNLTLLGTVMLMFIGASPGSTGGGIKTTSMGVLLALSRARLTGADNVHAFKRTISPGTINRSFSIFVVSVFIVLVGTACLLIAETSQYAPEQSRCQFMELLFETTSAFGTVGLSMGITPKLSSWSKFILVLIMFTGRLGPLVIAMAIHPSLKKGKFVYAEEPVMIG
jgi:trk system potassium uptake protein